jgi:polysaccharide pyruvyl transferase WcaK-like protein
MGRRDDASIRRIGAAGGSHIECVYERDPFALARLLRDCDVGLTTKCHASGLLYALGVPTVNVAYAPKCADLASVLSDTRFVVPIERVNEERLTQAVDDLAADIAHAAPRLAADVDRVRATWDEHFANAIAPIVDHMAGRYTNRKRAARVARALHAIPVYTLAVARRAHRALSHV